MARAGHPGMRPSCRCLWPRRSHRGGARGARVPWQTAVPRVAGACGRVRAGGGGRAEAAGRAPHGLLWRVPRVGHRRAPTWLTLPGVRRRERCSLP